MPEYKNSPQFTKTIEDRTVVGFFAVHGNVDEGGDRSHPGAFADAKVNGRDRAVFLWQHNSMDPPTAVINYVREVGREQLPASVLSFAPDATGAAEVSRTYLDTPRGDEILAALKAGAIYEMSYAYDVAGYAFTEDEDSGKTIRELYKLRLFDISDVNWGMNPATIASKRLGDGLSFTDHSDAVVSAVEEFLERARDRKQFRAKEGRVLSGENRKRIEAAVVALSDATKALSDLLAATEPKQQPERDADALHRLYWDYQRTLATINGVTFS